MANLDSDLLTIADAAKSLKLSTATIKRWVKEGRLPAYRLGPRQVRIRQVDLSQVLEPLGLRGLLPEEGLVPDRSPIEVSSGVERLTDEQVKSALQAMKAAELLRGQMRARRKGKALAPSAPIIRAAREVRSRRYE